MQFIRHRLPLLSSTALTASSAFVNHHQQHQRSFAFEGLASVSTPSIFTQTRSKFRTTRMLRQVTEEKQKLRLNGQHQHHATNGTMMNGDHSSSSTTTTMKNGATSGSSSSMEELLQQKVRCLEEQLKLRDNIIREFMSNMLDMQQRNGGNGASADHESNRNPHNPDCGRFVVSQGSEIADAVANGANHILLDATKITNKCLFLPHTLNVEGDHVLLIETLQSFTRMRNRTVAEPDANERIKIVGNWKLSKRVKFHSHDLDYSGDENESQSLFFLSSGASLVAHNCGFSDSREAVYLSSSGSATLSQCKIQNNVRGIFESYRSICKLIGCEFVDNYFHAVLLSKDAVAAASSANSGGAVVDPQQKRLDFQKIRLEQLIQDGNDFYCSSESPSAFCKKQVRGDVCFRYNPMLDQYEDVFLQGSKIVLTDSQATTDLVDSSW